MPSFSKKTLRKQQTLRLNEREENEFFVAVNKKQKISKTLKQKLDLLELKKILFSEEDKE